MNIPPEFTLVPKNWPVQVIRDHNPWWNMWRKTQADSAERTELTYEVVRRVWVPFANDKDLTPDLMNRWHEFILSRTRSGAGGRLTNDRINKYMRLVKKYLRWLKAMNIITHDPSFSLPMLKKDPPGSVKIWTHAEYKKLMAYCEYKLEYQTQLWLMALGYHTGMSLIDCCLLKWDEVSLMDNGPCYIHKIRQKMKSRMGKRAQCIIPIVPGSELWVWFKRMKRAREEIYQMDWFQGVDWVNHDAAEKYASTSTDADVFRWGHIFDSALGFERRGKSFKHFRNSFCSRLINAGVDALIVAQMTGHSNLKQLQEYVMPNIRTMQDALVMGLRWAEDHANSSVVIEAPDPQSVIASSTVS